MKYFNVAVKAPLMNPLVYQSEDPALSPGQVVQVPLGFRKVQGLVLSPAQAPSGFEVKNILSVEEDIHPLSAVRIQWIQWLSRYYVYPIGLTAGACYPSKKFKIKDFTASLSITPSQLIEDQKKCVSGIQKHSGFKVHLIHGVTGSGKTEVYFQLIQDQIKKGKQALVLVPEISLTPQLYSRFSKKFPNQVGLLHSGIQGKKRYEEWQRMVRGEKKILLGVRSALFCPLKKMSLIIVDEEHESHFKQEEKLKYHARDSAIVLAQMLNIPIVLGSATPDLTTWAKAVEGKYQYYSLKQRFQNRPMPQVQIVDLRKQKRILKKEETHLPFWLSSELFQLIQQTLKDKKQTALFLNRRGQSSLSLCLECGKVQICPNCDVSLTLHSEQYLVCHYCNYSIGSKQILCPDCQNSQISFFGIGTQGVYSEIQKLFPQAQVQLADRDHIQTPTELETLVKDMSDQKIDILIGTQMISKGLDFQDLNLVGLILADLALYGWDFRSAERCFQIITQMGGRSGRHSLYPGRVVVQTYNPDHYAIQKSSKLQFEEMAQKELEYRKKLKYPPYARLADIRISSFKKVLAEEMSHKLLNQLKGMKDSSFEFLGPAPESIFKLKLRYRYHILIKSLSASALQRVCDYVNVWRKELSSPVQVQINRDP